MKATIRHNYLHEAALSKGSVRPSCVKLYAESLDNKCSVRFDWPFGIIREVTGEQQYIEGK